MYGELLAAETISKKKFKIVAYTVCVYVYVNYT